MTDLPHRMAHTPSTGLASVTDVPTDDDALYAWLADRRGVTLPRLTCCPEH